MRALKFDGSRSASTQPFGALKAWLHEGLVKRPLARVQAYHCSAAAMAVALQISQEQHAHSSVSAADPVRCAAGHSQAAHAQHRGRAAPQRLERLQLLPLGQRQVTQQTHPAHGHQRPRILCALKCSRAPPLQQSEALLLQLWTRQQTHERQCWLMWWRQRRLQVRGMSYALPCDAGCIADASRLAAGQTGLAYLHSTHCLADGTIMISTMGDPQGNAKGNFLILDQNLKVKGKWAKEDTAFGYDFW